MSSAKPSKAVLSRIRVTKKGKLLSRGKGIGHFNAKKARSKQLSNKRDSELNISTKMKQRYIQ